MDIQTISTFEKTSLERIYNRDIGGISKISMAVCEG